MAVHKKGFRTCRIKKALAVIAASASFFMANPLVDRVRADETKPTSSIITYRCSMKEEKIVRTRNSISRRAIRIYELVFDAPVLSAGLKSITLSSNDSYFNGKTLNEFPHLAGEYSYKYYAGSHSDDNAFSQYPFCVGRFKPCWTEEISFNGRKIEYKHDDFDANTTLLKYGYCESAPKPSTDLAKSSVKPSPDAGTSDSAKPASVNLMRGVFIRPCPGRFYDSSAFQSQDTDAGTKDTATDAGTKDPADLKTTVGGGTLRKACEDLRDSGVTDIFLPFKVDDQVHAPQCGTYGQLLYPSREFNKRVSQFVNDAKTAGFDPNGSIMSVCREVYGDKSLRFHAWFPVFQDPYAAQIQGVSGKLKFSLSDNVLGQGLDKIALPNDVSYTSRLFAEPGNSRVRAQELGILKEIVRLYPKLYGINLDYIRYPEQEIVVDVPKPGTPLPKPGDPLQCIRDPREASIQDKDCKDIDSKYIAKRVIWNVDSSAVEKFVKTVKVTFPNKKLSADVFASVGAMFGVGQIGVLAQVPAQLDIIMPMAYVSPVSDVLKELKVLYPNTTIVPDLRGWRNSGDGEGLITDLAQGIQSAKKGEPLDMLYSPMNPC